MHDDTINELRVARKLIEAQRKVIQLLHDLLEQKQGETDSGGSTTWSKVIRMPLKPKGKK